MCFAKLPPGWRGITRESISELDPDGGRVLGNTPVKEHPGLSSPSFAHMWKPSSGLKAATSVALHGRVGADELGSGR
jgi:hypothetical protein